MLQEGLTLALREGGFVRDPIPPLRFYQHHLCHAATAFYCSGFSEAAVLVFDGHGEERTVSFYHGNGRSLRAAPPSATTQLARLVLLRHDRVPRLGSE